MSPNGTHPRLKVKEPRSGRNEHRHAARLKCGLSLRLAKKPLWLRMSVLTRRSCVARAVFSPDDPPTPPTQHTLAPVLPNLGLCLRRPLPRRSRLSQSYSRIHVSAVRECRRCGNAGEAIGQRGRYIMLVCKGARAPRVAPPFQDTRHSVGVLPVCSSFGVNRGISTHARCVHGAG